MNNKYNKYKKYLIDDNSDEELNPLYIENTDLKNKILFINNKLKNKINKKKLSKKKLTTPSLSLIKPTTPSKHNTIITTPTKSINQILTIEIDQTKIDEHNKLNDDINKSNDEYDEYDECDEYAEDDFEYIVNSSDTDNDDD